MSSRYVFEAMARARDDGLCPFCRTPLTTRLGRKLCLNEKCRRAPGRGFKLSAPPNRAKRLIRRRTGTGPAGPPIRKNKQRKKK